ncbi:hypothetical protein LOAG_04473 [Loa loa]|uniref:CCHC-type domain-containing protein n=1 Tax=Loa loa TaxID=7209 RepID=A0A1I7VZ53_LOALO|nr:hypothetical protein LOAG_04473 [Loa loa]EFO24010.1 hypothetical protein LOAG_04473 [Loa loa]
MSSLEYKELPNRPEQPGSSVMRTDMYGGIRNQKMTTGACRKCGYPGHLPFQCYNFLRPSGGRCTDISSTSSESEYETPLTAKESKRKMKRKSKKHNDHEHRKRRKKSHNSSTKCKIKKKRREKRLNSSTMQPSNLKKMKTGTEYIYKCS